MIGRPFNCGVLARPGVGTYDYADAPPRVLARGERLAATCRFDMPLAAAALQFAAADPAVVSVMAGAQSASEAGANVASMDLPMPPALWAALEHEGLIDPAASIPTGQGRPC